jgi:SAM-dependent methyltransferase
MHSENADLIRANRDLWDGWAELHVAGKGYDVESFKAGRQTLDAVELEGVGDVRDKSLLHLQCHFGMDTLNWARLGARVVGVDFSEKAVGHARRLAHELGIGARFILADVTDTATVLSQLGEQFDVVFTSHGTISWLPDLRPWARTVAGALKPGGLFFIADAHPFTWMFDDERADPALEFRYRYFGREALRFEEKGSYAEPEGDFEGVSYSWQHTFAEIVSSLAEAGLAITSLREYPYLFWRWFPWMVRSDDGTYRMPEGLPEIPIMFSLSAIKR